MESSILGSRIKSGRQPQRRAARLLGWGGTGATTFEVTATAYWNTQAGFKTVTCDFKFAGWPFDVTSSSGFEVYDAAPVIGQITDVATGTSTSLQGEQGTTLIITGSNMGTGGQISVSGGSGVTYTGYTKWTPSEIDATFNIDANAQLGTYTLMLNESSDDTGLTFQRGPSGSNQGSGQWTVAKASVSLSPVTLNLSTGDTRYLTTTVSPSAIFTSAPVFQTALAGPQHPGSACSVALSVQAALGPLYNPVQNPATAAPAGCSGVFNLSAITQYGQSGVSTAIVPPQALIQMLWGEAKSQPHDLTDLILGAVVKNRFGDCVWFSCVGTWQDAITPGQFQNLATYLTNGPDWELSNAAHIYTADPAFSAVGLLNRAGCFFSPTPTDWKNIQTALQSATTTLRLPARTRTVTTAFRAQPRNIS